ncbi:MAG: helix-turn-helix transcriptional regulator [Cyclobacteriaceae bacterium]
MKEENIIIARIFLFCRQLLGLSQHKMAALLLVNQSTVNRIEKGALRPSDGLLRKLEEIIRLDMEQLFYLATQQMG